MMSTSTFRLCVVAGVLLALLAPAAAQCSNMCKPVSVGGKTANCAYKPSVYSGARFASTDFGNSCLGDAARDCADSTNTVQVGSTVHSCCGCYLYAKHCHGSGKAFVTSGSLGGDMLLMPGTACTGVENWNNPGNHKGCPGEAIWDEGRNILKNAGKDASWGMAINPVNRRGQHQMHVHIAQMYKGLEQIIDQVAKSGVTEAFLSCKGSSVRRRVESCTVLGSGNKDNDVRIQIFRKVGSPSGANPFSSAYGTNLSNNNKLILSASTLVAAVPNTHFKDWAVITNPHGQAECYFAATEKHCDK